MKNLFRRILELPIIIVIHITFYLSHRLYMKFYIPYLKYKGVKFSGKPRYIGLQVKFDNYKNIQLGERVVISNECHFLTHDYSLTTALISIGEKPRTDIALERNIIVGNNVFIGKKSIIMPNCEIGSNIIIGAGSVVRGKIPSNSILLGNPAKIIGDIQSQAIKWKKFIGTDIVRQD